MSGSTPTQEVDEIADDIADQLAVSPTGASTGEPMCEWAIFDYQGFGHHVRIQEYERLDRISTLAQGIAEHGLAYAAWWDLRAQGGVGDPTEMFSFEEDYYGEFDDVTAYAESMLNDMGIDPWNPEFAPEHVRPYTYVDGQKLGRDLEYGGDIDTRTSGRGGVYVFIGW